MKNLFYKVGLCIVIIFSSFFLSGCENDEHYNEEDIVVALKQQFDKDFIVLSIDEKSDNTIVYTIQLEEDKDIVFEATSYYDDNAPFPSGYKYSNNFLDVVKEKSIERITSDNSEIQGFMQPYEISIQFTSYEDYHSKLDLAIQIYSEVEKNTLLSFYSIPLPVYVVYDFPYCEYSPFRYEINSDTSLNILKEEQFEEAYFDFLLTYSIEDPQLPQEKLNSFIATKSVSSFLINHNGNETTYEAPHTQTFTYASLYHLLVALDYEVYGTPTHYEVHYNDNIITLSYSFQKHKDELDFDNPIFEDSIYVSYFTTTENYSGVGTYKYSEETNTTSIYFTNDKFEIKSYKYLKLNSPSDYEDLNKTELFKLLDLHIENLDI